MTREEKGVIIEELAQKFQTIPFFYITEASGMTVDQVNQLRRMCFERGIEYKVVKNTFIKKALETVAGADFTPFNDTVLKGQSGVMFHSENQKAPAQLIKEFRKTNDKLQLKGASIDASLFIGADQLETLISLKSRQELIGDIVGLLQSPAKNVVSALQSGGGKLAGILKTLSEREEAQS